MPVTLTYIPPTTTTTTPGGPLRRPFFAGSGSSYLDLIPEEEEEEWENDDDDEDGIDAAEIARFARMAETDVPGLLKAESAPAGLDQQAGAAAQEANRKLQPSAADGAEAPDGLTVPAETDEGLTTPALTRTSSSTDVSGGSFDGFGQSEFPPVDRLTMFDILENLALPQRLEKMQLAVHQQAEKVRRQQARLARKALSSKNNLVEEWRKRVVDRRPEEQLDKYRRRMVDSVERLASRWNDAKTVTLKEKISFVVAVLNIFISGYLIGAYPEYFHYWYSVQLAYFMPIRWYNYHKIGFHYFLADLCYFVNLLLILSIWFFPQSKRLFISTYCLAFGNNAVAIALWRNSLVFHSLDKTTTLFIHIMPCATLHVLVHLLPESMQREKFPAVHTIKYSSPDAPEHYRLADMIIWATLPYAVWQLSYHFLITIRKRQKIAAGRPTSFTWLRRSYRGNFLGKFVLSFPEAMQEAIFMCIQYLYALLTMLPCPLWFWYRWASATFMMVVFSWASWNGASYYIDVFGKRMEKELEQLRKEVARMSKSPEINGQYGPGVESPAGSPEGPQGMEGGVVGSVAKTSALDLGPAAAADVRHSAHRRSKSEGSVDDIALEVEDGPAANGDVAEEIVTSAAPGVEVKKVLKLPSDTPEVNAVPDVNGSPTTNGVDHHEKSA